VPLKKPSEFYIKNPSTSMDEVKEGLNVAAPEKIENLSEAFNVFKTNLNHIQSISDFTNKFDSFENNVQKVELLSQNVEEIRENIDALIKQEDLDEAMTAHLFFVEESIKNVQDKVKTLNSKSILEIKKDFSSLTETVNDFIGVEVPAYKTLIVDSETRVDSRFNNFKEDLTSQVEGVHKEIQSNLAQVTKNIDSINEKKVSSVKEEVKGIGSKVENLIEKVLPSYKKFFADTQVNVEERISHVSDTAKEIEEQYQSNINDIKEKFNEFVGQEVPKYKSLLVETKVKTEKEVKEISNEMGVRISLINRSVEDLQERVDNKEIELDKNLLKKTEEIEELLEDLTSLSSTYDTLQKDFKQREVSENKKLENYEKRINQVEETLSNEILELQENLDTSTSKYYQEMKDTLVPAVVSFEKNLTEKLKDLNVNFTVNEKHVQDLQKEFKDLVEKLRVDELEERSDNLTQKIDKLEDVLEKFNDEQQQLTEGLLNIPPNVDNQDPLTPLDQTYVTHEKLAEHYRLFINRVQQQLSTIGGGGEVFLARMQDVAVGAGIQTNNWVLSWDTSIKMFTPSAGGSAGAAGTWASNSIGVSTTKNVGIATTARTEYSLYVGKGPTAGSATTTVVAYFDGDISVGGTIFKENVKNVDSIGLVTARSGVDIGYDYDGGTGIGATLTSGGDAIFAGIVTASIGLVPPVITTSSRDSTGITTATGSIIYNTTTAQLEVYSGSAWVGVGAVNNLTISNL